MSKVKYLDWKTRVHLSKECQVYGVYVTKIMKNKKYILQVLPFTTLSKIAATKMKHFIFAK